MWPIQANTKFSHVFGKKISEKKKKKKENCQKCCHKMESFVKKLSKIGYELFIKGVIRLH